MRNVQNVEESRLTVRKTFSSLSCISWAMILVLAVSFVGYSQSSTATLSGTIQDENGAVIPGAAIAVVNEATSFKRTATTNESGSFTIPLLPPGEYTVLVEREGFTRVQLTNIVLNVGDQKAVQVQLKVGDVASTVEVLADASTVRTDGSVGTVIDQQFVKNIPLNGRSFQSLIALTPGVTLVGGFFGEYVVNGQRTNSNYTTVDGVDANAGLTGINTQPNPAGISGQTPGATVIGTTTSLVAVDALQEFRIQTSSFAPEFGRTVGGQVQLVTKSGTNEFHGTAFEYIRNEAFEANDWFANRSNQKRPLTRQHQFGGTLGGPLPFFNFGDGGGPLFHSGRGRTHFFFSYEGLRLEQPKTQLAGMPTACFRGIAVCEGGRPAAHAVYQPFLRVFPLPNGPEIFVSCATNDTDPLCTPGPSGGRVKPSGFAQYAASYSDPSSYDATSIRIDHTSGPFAFFGRYSQTPSHAATRLVGQVTRNSLDNRGLTLGSTWTISKRLFNDLRLNRTVQDSEVVVHAGGIDGGEPLTAFSFIGRSPETSRFDFLIVQSSTVSTITPAYRVGTTSEYLQRHFNIVDNLLWTAGDHQLKFGVDFRRVHPVVQPGLTGAETLQVTPSMLTTNQVQLYAIQAFDGNRHAAVFDSLSLYAQDTWRMNKRLTVTYGVRWEFVPPPRATEGAEAATIDGPLESPGILAPNVLSIAPAGTRQWKTRHNNFAPRFGASYLLFQNPGRELVVRGGVGVFYDLGLGTNSVGGYSINWPNSNSISYPIAGAGSTCPSPLRLPLPACALVQPVLGVTPPSSLSIMDRNIVLPRVYQWNFSAEQSLGKSQTLTVSYVGAASRRLLSNNTYPGTLTATYPGIRLQGFTYTGTAGTTLSVQRNDSFSNYHALQAQFQRRLTNGLQALVAYTYSISKDTESIDNTGIQSDVVPISYRYGFSDFDVRHNLQAAVTYHIPALKWNPIVEAVTRDWGLDLRISVRSALPVEPIFSAFIPELNTTRPVRVDVVPGQPFWIDDENAPGGRRLNLAAFAIPPGNHLGNLPRNVVRGFPAQQVDVSLHREFPLLERLRLQLRADVFNVTNTPNFAISTFDAVLAPGVLQQNFGAASSMLNRGNSQNQLNALYKPGGPRSMQFSAKLTF